MKNSKIQNSNLKKILFISMLMGSFSLFSQVSMEQDFSQDNVKEESISIPTELKQNPEEFYIINDKPVTREEYLNYLAKKEDDEKSSPE